LGGVFELLTAKSWNDEEVGLDLGESGKVGPEFFKLGDGKDVFLAVAPAFFDFLNGDVSGESFGNGADGDGDFIFVVSEDIITGETEESEELVDVDPSRHGVVITEVELILFMGEGKAFEETGASVNTGKAATAVFEPAGDDFECQAAATF
jgi:hypothetical protein